jgi:hypothetical protein
VRKGSAFPACRSLCRGYASAARYRGVASASRRVGGKAEPFRTADGGKAASIMNPELILDLERGRAARDPDRFFTVRAGTFDKSGCSKLVVPKFENSLCVLCISVVPLW